MYKGVSCASSSDDLSFLICKQLSRTNITQVDHNLAASIAILEPPNSINLLRQIIPIRALLAIDERDLVVTIGRSVGHDALHAQSEPGLGVGDEGGCGDFANRPLVAGR